MLRIHVMIPLARTPHESLDQYLGRAVMAARTSGTSIGLDVAGVTFVVSSRMSVLEAAAEWRRASGEHQLVSAPLDYRGGAGRFLAP